MGTARSLIILITLLLWTGKPLALGFSDEIGASDPARYKYTMGEEVWISCKEFFEADLKANFQHKCPNSQFPNSTVGMTVRARWENLDNKGKDAEPLVGGSLGTLDFWQSDEATTKNSWVNVSGTLYMMPKHAPDGPSSSGYERFVNVQVEGVYFPCIGRICMVGCYSKQESMEIPIEAIPTDEILDGEELADAEAPSVVTAAQEEDVPRTTVDVALKQEEEAIESGATDLPFDPTWKMTDIGDCSVRMVFEFSGKPSHLKLDGFVSSLVNATEDKDRHFDTLKFHGHLIDLDAQSYWYLYEVAYASAFLLLALIFNIRQLMWTRKCAGAQYTSIFMVFVQLAVGAYLWGREYFYAFRFMTLEVLWYQVNGVHALPRFLSLAILLVQFILQLAIRRRRRIARQDYADPKLAPTEKPAMFGCAPIYAFAAVVWWWGEDLETFFKVVQYCYLVPQIVSNVVWGTPAGPRPIHETYSVGLSLVQIAELFFTTYRPAFLGYVGYDDLFDFPHAWFLGVAALILAQAIIVVQQQRKGGRCLVPAPYYRYLPVGRDDAGDEPALTKGPGGPSMLNKLGSISRILLDGEKGGPNSAPGSPGAIAGSYQPPSMLSRLSSAKKVIFNDRSESRMRPNVEEGEGQQLLGGENNTK